MSDTFNIRIELGELSADTVQIAELTGREAISRLFEFEILLVSSSAGGLDTQALTGACARLVFERGGEEVRRILGMIASIEERLDGASVHSTYRLLFVPRAFRMTLHETLDISMNLSVPEILEKTLDLAGLDADDVVLRLERTYPPREFVVQYKETDLAFVSRLTEHLGISFFFEHEDDRDILVFTDGNAGFRPAVGAPAAQLRSRGDHRDVYELKMATRVISSQYVVRDYNYRIPQVDLTAVADMPDGYGGRVIEYGAHVKTPEEAGIIAMVRAEEQQATRRVFTGESDIVGFSAGATCLIEGHPSGDLDLLFTEVTHRARLPAFGAAAEGDCTYSNTFRAILRSTPFRPARVTPKPKVHGVITGVVDAAHAGQYAELDDEGRYRVRFLFDTSSPGEGQASRSVRMMQPHSGPGYGMHFPLRPGIEVALTCIDGDPDRPIIAGTVPNPLTSSPVAAGNAPRNIIRTGGNNEINIDDTEGSERIKMTTPRSDTSFQLGAPNDPIDGVSLKTTGHTSNVATAGASQWASFGMQFSAIVDLLRSSTIVNVASSTSLLGLAAIGAGMAQAAYTALPPGKALGNFNAAYIEQEKQALAAAESAQNELAVAASQAAKSKQKECNLCRSQAKASLPAAALQDPSIQAAIDDYDAACNRADDDYLTAIGTMEDRNGIIDVNRTGFGNADFEPVMQRDALASIAPYDYAAFEALKDADESARWDALTPAERATASGVTEAAWTAKTPAEKTAARAAWLAEEKKKWAVAPPADPGQAAVYNAYLESYSRGLTTADTARFAALTETEKDAIGASIRGAAGIPAGSTWATLTADQKTSLQDAWLASESNNWPAVTPASAAADTTYSASNITADTARFTALTATEKDALVIAAGFPAGSTWASLTPAQQTAFKSGWLAEERKKWEVVPPDPWAAQSFTDYASYVAAKTQADNATWTALPEAQKDQIDASVWEAAGIPASPPGSRTWATLTPVQQASLRDAWLAAQQKAWVNADDRKARDVKREALRAKLAGNANYTAYLQALDTCGAKCGSELDQARQSAMDENEKVAKIMHDNVPRLQDLMALSNNNSSAMVMHVQTGINALLKLYALADMYHSRTSVIDRWGAAKDMARDSNNPLGEADIGAAHINLKKWDIPIFRPQHTHVIGSDKSTEVYGKRDVVVWSRTAMLLGIGTEESPAWYSTWKRAAAAAAGGALGALGWPSAPDSPDKAKGTALVLGGEAVRIMSPGAVDVFGANKVQLDSSTLVDVLSRGSISLTVEKKGAPLKYKSHLEMKKREIALSVSNVDGDSKGTLTLAAPAGPAKVGGKVVLKTIDTQSLEMDEAAKSTKLKAGATYALTLNEAAGTAQLLAGTWALDLEKDGGGVKLGNNAWQLQVKPNDVTLGGAGPRLQITDKLANLTAVETITLKGPNLITLDSATVAFGAAAITSDNLVVKGGFDASIALLRGELIAAQEAAEGAEQAARTVAEALVASEQAQALLIANAQRAADAATATANDAKLAAEAAEITIIILGEDA